MGDTSIEMGEIDGNKWKKCLASLVTDLYDFVDIQIEVASRFKRQRSWSLKKSHKEQTGVSDIETARLTHDLLSQLTNITLLFELV